MCYHSFIYNLIFIFILLKEITGMIEFEVLLKEKDIKSFILYNMGVYRFRFLFPLILYFFCAVLFLIYGIFFSSSHFFVFFGSVFFGLFWFGVFKAYSIFRRMFVRSFELVDKKRFFYIDRRCLNIEYENDVELCGRYFFYDLKKYEVVKEYIYIYFNQNIFIILPIRALKNGQYKKIIDILKSSATN